VSGTRRRSTFSTIMTFTARCLCSTPSSLKADLKRSLKPLTVLKAFLLITHVDERHRQLEDLFVIPLSVILQYFRPLFSSSSVITREVGRYTITETRSKSNSAVRNDLKY
jgi:hypothetical protein